MLEKTDAGKAPNERPAHKCATCQNDAEWGIKKRPGLDMKEESEWRILNRVVRCTHDGWEDEGGRAACVDVVHDRARAAAEWRKLGIERAQLRVDAYAEGEG